MATDLWQLDMALAGLRAREAELLARRDQLLGLLRSERDRLAGSDPGVRQAAEGDPDARWVAEGGSGARQAAGIGSGVRPVAGSGLGVRQAAGTGPGPAQAELPAPAAPRRDFSPKAVQNLLLVLGGLLLVVAAIVFTVVSWGHIGIGGRAAILSGITLATLAVPKLLVRRDLIATAETIAMLGVALLFLDGYAARRVGIAGADGIAGLDYAALLFGLVALIMAGYSRLIPLRLPLPVAIVLAQLPLPLLALSETASWITAALAATAAADAAFLMLARGKRPVTVSVDGKPEPATVSAGEPDPVVVSAGEPDPVAISGGEPDPAAVSGGGEPEENAAASHRSGAGTSEAGAGDVRPVGAAPGVRATLWACFGVVWTLGVGCGFLNSALGLTGSFPAEDLMTSSVKGALLVVLAMIGAVMAPRVGLLRFLTAGSVFALTAGLAAPVWPLLPFEWWAVPYTAAALVAGAAALYLPGLNDPRVRSAGAVSAGILAAITAVPFLPAVVFILYTPFGRLDDVWPEVYGSVGRSFPAIPVVLGLLAAAAAATARRGRSRQDRQDHQDWQDQDHQDQRDRRDRQARVAVRMGLTALALGTLTVAVAPAAFGWSYPADLAVLLILAAVLVACLSPVRWSLWAGALTVAAVAVTAMAVATALAGRVPTYVALAVLLAVWGLASFTARVPWAAATALVTAVLSATGLIWAVAVGTRWQPVGDGLSLALAIGAVLAGLLAPRWSAGRAGAVSADGSAVQADAASAGGPAVRADAASAGGSPPAGATPADGAAVPMDTASTVKAVVDPRWTAGLVLSAVLAALAVLPVHSAVAAISGFYRPLALPWTPLGDPVGHHPLFVVITVLVAASAVLVSWQAAGRKGMIRAGLTAWPVVLVALPISVGLLYGVEVGWFVAGLGPLAWMAARSRTNWAFGGAAALWTASIAISWALMSKPATLIVLPVVAAVAVATASLGRIRAVRAGGAGLATLLTGAEALAAGLALEWPVRHAAFGVLAVACLAAAVAGRFRRSVFAIGVEAAGYVLAVVGLLLGSGDLPSASLACAVAGVLMAGTALRPDRRWAGYVGTGLLLAASWLRLLASDITVVEAYTVPFSLVLLAFGWWRARSREVSSWVSYGSGLASSLLPSLIAVLTGSGWLRPLLLGVIALAVLLAGARFRLQAPALLGGLTLAVVALHELAPWIRQVVMTVPRWVPMAMGGLLLVVIGATYEARLKDVRRLRTVIGRMR
ncbi:SCO7613 C-terminal domain-containing membrane protein [Streptosporangium sp. NPDC000396]|uniref:SCO7613 C-terminal domain-containing membrane protein n=1 Tax=Streptosporangium sp. NPDC000396 TaxID=3366185 RepID=UPI00368E0809